MVHWGRLTLDIAKEDQTMAGQPQVPTVLEFDVTGLTISELPGEWAPTIIVDSNKPFRVGARFEGSEPIWIGMTNAGLPYQVHYFAEGYGSSTAEVELGVRNGNLNPGQSAYTATDTQVQVPASTLSPGVYELACLVRFPGWPGITGFEKLMLEVY
jgi:hypothetical protein